MEVRLPSTPSAQLAVAAARVAVFQALWVMRVVLAAVV
jgi:hypothetical protein